MAASNKIQVGYIEAQDGAQFEVDAGTAAAPGLCFDDSAATGLYSPGTGQLAFSTSSKQTALRILADGKVGIDCSPTVALEVNGTIKAGAIEAPIEGTLDDWIVHAGDTNTKFGFPAADEFEIHAGGGPTLRIDSTGKLGINHSSPSTIIHAVGNSTVGTSVTMTLQSHDTVNATAGVNLLARNSSNVNKTSKILATSGGTANVDLTFHTHDSEKLRINSNGQLLVGTTTTPSNSNSKLRVHFDQNTSSGSAIEMSHSTNGADKAGAALGLAIANGGASTNAADLYFSTATNGSLVEKLRIDSSGRLLINRTASRAISGDNAKLQIENPSSGLLSLLRTSNDNGAAWLAIAKSRSAAGAACQAGDQIGGIAFTPHDGTDLNHHAAEIRAYVDTGIGGDDTPGYLTFNTNSGASTTTERLRIKSDGEILLGTGGVDRPIAGQRFNSGSGWGGTLQIEKPNPSNGNNNVPFVAITAWNGANEQYTGGISFNRSNNNTQGTQGAVNSNQQLGNIAFNGSDGTNFIQGAEIFAIPDQTFATNDGPASLVFATTPDGTSETRPQERFRIDSSGYLKHTGLRAGNSENKLAILTAPSYNTSEEDVIVYQVENESGSNQLSIGGGTGSLNAMTALSFRTASAVNTTGGSEKLRITSDGEIRCMGAADDKGFAVYLDSTRRVAELIEHSSDGEIRLYTGESTPVLRTVLTSYGNSYINAAGTGRFGVGTTSPDHIFEVESNNSSIAVSRTGSNAQLLFKSNSVGQAGQIQVSESSGGGVMLFYNKTTSGTLTENLRIGTDGTTEFAAKKWRVNASNGQLEEYPYNTSTSSFSSSTSNGYHLARVRNGQVPQGTSGNTYTLLNTSTIGEAGAYILVLRSFEQAQTGGNLWSVRMVTSPFYLHHGSGNDGETLTIPYTYSGHANNATNQAGNGHGPIILRTHFYNGSAHTAGKITISFEGFNYTGTNCDYYLYKLIDV